MISIRLFIIYAVFVLFAAALRLLLTFGVAAECENRETGSKKLWVILTAVIGMISAITFICFAARKDKAKIKKSNNRKAKLILLLFIFTLIGAVLFTAFCAVPTFINQENEAANSFGSSDVTYKDENGNDIIYDKMGNTYTFDEFLNDYKWYDRKANSYRAIIDEQDCRIGMQCIETGKEYTEDMDSEYSIYIDDDGYLCIFNQYSDEISIYMPEDIGEGVYFDNYHHLYYKPDDVFYDENGNVVFRDDYAFKDFKYADIPPEEFEIFN